MHDGHRQRLKIRFLTEGLDNFEAHAVLELVLFYALPRQDVNPLAHELINRFGKLSAVFDAPIESLMKTPGIGEHAAALIKLVPALCRRYQVSRIEGEQILNTTSRAGAYLLPRFVAHKNEVVYLVCLDSKCKVLGCTMLFEGSVNSAGVSVRKIVETALSFNATGVILAHNHISGVALPSADDESTTAHIKAALRAVGIRLNDHLIVADGDFVSMADSGYLSDD